MYHLLLLLPDHPLVPRPQGGRVLGPTQNNDNNHNDNNNNKNYNNIMYYY